MSSIEHSLITFIPHVSCCEYFIKKFLRHQNPGYLILLYGFRTVHPNFNNKLGSGQFPI